MEEIYLAGGCLWGVQEFLRHVPGVVETEAGRANGTGRMGSDGYDGYAECVRTGFDPGKIAVGCLLAFFFEIIDPYSLNRQGMDVGLRYRTGVYSESSRHLREAMAFIRRRPDRARIAVEVLPLSRYVRSDREHQDRLTLHPEDLRLCHLPIELLHKYKRLREDPPAHPLPSPTLRAISARRSSG